MSADLRNGAPVVVAGRYRLEAPLGSGGAATVFAAVDLLTGRSVALKHMRLGAGTDAARARLEIAILRRLQRPALLPGVVRLLDDGGDAEHAWLVMERIDGAPFPAREPPCRWEEIEPVTLSLLDTIAQLHGAGVAHLDLKPENVLIDANGRAVIVDFGISSVADDLAPSDDVRGTREYLAPERLRGEGGPRADLYAVGVMLYRALTGGSPRLPSGELVSMPRGVPAEVAAVCARLVAERPDDRPGSAREVLALLRSDSTPRAGAEPEAVCAPEALARRFAGPERLLHLPSDAAAVLARRTGGRAREVDAELARWVHARLAAFDGERFHVSRASLDLLSEPPARRRETPLGWVTRAGRLAAEGHHARAESLLREALRAAAAPPADERVLVRAARTWIALVIAARDRSATARFLYELSRVDPKPPVVAAIEALAHAHDEAIRWMPEALERARDVPAFEQRDLEQLRLGVRVFAARKVSVEALREEVRQLLAASRSEHPSWVRARAVATGRLRYVEERYAEAAASHERAAEASTWRAARLDALLNAASARMEAFQLTRAIELAALARDEARLARLAFLEGRAEWIGRTASDRARIELAPDLELVDAVRHLGAPDLVLLVAVTEATLAFRSGDRQTFAELAAVARDACGLDNEPLGMATIDALEVALGIRAASPRDLALADRLAERGVPRLALEVAALVEGDRPRSAERAAWLRSLARTVPARFQDCRLGALSAREALVKLGLPPKN